ncbi:hypothetical protein HZA76_03860 [Candidatus Roizmanbacteria bacterium]|nr:hypothetical protein [Candidatus Roizmanbacteria bacterium]
MINLLIAGNAFMIVSFIFKFNSLPPQLPLFYSHPWGEAQLVDTWMIFLIPLLLNLLYVVNNYLYKKFFSGNELIKKMFDYLMILLIVGFTLIFIKIIFLVS